MNQFVRLLKQQEYKNTLEAIKEREIDLKMLRARERSLRRELEAKE